MNISVVVLNYNGLENTKECLDSIKKLELANHKLSIVLVDNASKDGSQEALF